MDPVQEIKNRLSIVDVVREYAQLHPSGNGGNFKMVCPFHDDHSPSMIVSERKGLAWCFACNNGGDIFSFIQKIEGCNFPESIRVLAEKAGVALQEYKPETKKDDRDKERVYEALEESTEFFEKQLIENSRAQKILNEREIPSAVLRKFRVGFAPKSGHALEKHMLEQGFSRKEMLLAGLVVSEDNIGENIRDKFKDRIMFPIWNTTGRICAFGGRYIGNMDKAPKYLNSPETAVFKKSEILYGMNFAKDSCKKERFVLVTEGYFDVLACVSAGIENVVATSGTAFTPQHAKLIGRYVKEVALALDVDEAGQSASRRSAGIILSHKLDVTVVSIPGGKDPDEAIREDKQEFLRAITERKSCIEAFFQRAFLHRNSTKIEDKKKILDELLPIISSFPRDIEKDHFLQKLAEKLGTRSQILQEEYKRFSRFTEVRPRKVSSTSSSPKISPIEYLLGILLSYPELFEESQKHFLADLLPKNEEKKIYKLITDTYTAKASLSPEEVFQKLSEEESKKWRILAVYAEERNEIFSEAVRKKECLKIIHNLNTTLIPQKLNELGVEIKKKSGDTPVLLSQINELTKLLHKFHHQ